MTPILLYTCSYFILMALSALGFLSLRRIYNSIVPPIYYNLYIVITLWSGLIYFNFLGQKPLSYFTWYANWLITTPLTVLALSLFALFEQKEKHWQSLIAFMGVQIFSILAGLGAHIYWPSFIANVLFIVACITMFGTFSVIWGPLMRIASESSSMLHQRYFILALLSVRLWVIYPAIWLLSTPALKTISSFTTNMLFTILTLLSNIGIGFYYLISLQKIAMYNLVSLPKKTQSVRMRKVNE